jgi:UDP-2,4-diacetamido-2,4,6-trideoxy-beta-L-altropyranose hydrolase
MRCLALAQAWQEQGGNPVFALAKVGSAIVDCLREENYKIEPIAAEPGSSPDAQETAALAGRLGAEWVVVDGYHFDSHFQRRLKDTASRLLAIDDYGHAGQYVADLILNQNLGVEEGMYRDRAPYTGLLLGTQFALLRREFLQRLGWRREVPEIARRVLVSLGGADPNNVTLKVIEALRLLPPDSFEAVIVAGAASPNLASLEHALRGAPHGIRLRTNVSDMAAFMTWADVMVGAAGTTSWERAYFGLPSLVMVLADNQVAVAAATERAGISHNLGWHHDLSAAALAASLGSLLSDARARAEMARRGPEVIDGRGPRRVLARLRYPELNLRRACSEDCHRVWEWANDPTVRSMSFTADPIPWAQHQHWFASRLADPGCLLFIATRRSAPIGQVRMDVAGPEAVISISLDASVRGHGLGPSIIDLACQEVFCTAPVKRVVALARENNTPSHRAFQKAGFVDGGPTMVRGCAARQFVLHKGTGT